MNDERRRFSAFEEPEEKRGLFGRRRTKTGNAFLSGDRPASWTRDDTRPDDSSETSPYPSRFEQREAAYEEELRRETEREKQRERDERIRESQERQKRTQEFRERQRAEREAEARGEREDKELSRRARKNDIRAQVASIEQTLAGGRSASDLSRAGGSSTKLTWREKRELIRRAVETRTLPEGEVGDKLRELLNTQGWAFDEESTPRSASMSAERLDAPAPTHGTWDSGEGTYISQQIAQRAEKPRRKVRNVVVGVLAIILIANAGSRILSHYILENTRPNSSYSQPTQRSVPIPDGAAVAGSWAIEVLSWDTDATERYTNGGGTIFDGEKVVALQVEVTNRDSLSLSPAWNVGFLLSDTGSGKEYWEDDNAPIPDALHNAAESVTSGATASGWVYFVVPTEWSEMEIRVRNYASDHSMPMGFIVHPTPPYMEERVHQPVSME
ncbi:hypothetical protein I6E29_07095 [Arcanobacterium haemolyticum]|nr:hypothetical protein [Arcanobacterium haemolyticum]